jgi:hypothetical protein
MTRAEAIAILDNAAAQLAEHFEAVQISVAWIEESSREGTSSEHAGRGVWYARYGLAQEFIDRGKAAEIGDAVARATEGRE